MKAKRIINRLHWLTTVPPRYLIVRSKGTFPARKTENRFKENGKSLVGVVCGNAREAVEKSIGLIGGIDKLEIKGKTVFIKIAANSDDPPPAIINPETLKALISTLKEQKPKRIIAGDMSGHSWVPTRDVLEKMGIIKAIHDSGAEQAVFDDSDWITIKDERMSLKKIRIPKILYDSDIYINMPVMKTHRSTAFSMSLKNFTGAIHMIDRWRMHGGDLEAVCAEINLAMQPDLIVMDGTKSMIDGGPTHGTAKDTNIVISSGDMSANDITGVSILRYFGAWKKICEKKAIEQTQIKRALELGIGTSDIEVREFSFQEDGEFKKMMDFARSSWEIDQGKRGFAEDKQGDKR
ncbi:DUF362 domain-containing protein [Candidatus Woesearchaeota archaeon]|nr:DUF362 domain-containing protein [Candidatus Woesearchaeota archaeon]